MSEPSVQRGLAFLKFHPNGAVFKNSYFRIYAIIRIDIAAGYLIGYNFEVGKKLIASVNVPQLFHNICVVINFERVSRDAIERLGALKLSCCDLLDDSRNSELSNSRKEDRLRHE
mmetsp:Transcript_3877/g.6804  ORF Transcript_3877/g.6804 Transcript_3877/m.6804 type:complete len:115 (+) Transcript_3877:276-620(+)